jgi:hypothetical protein
VTALVLDHLAQQPVQDGVVGAPDQCVVPRYLFGDSPEGREHAAGIDETISAVPGLEGLALIQDYLDAAERRVRERPGWAGPAPMPDPRRDNGRRPAPTHWRESDVGRT